MRLPGLDHQGPVYQSADLGQWLAIHFRTSDEDGIYCQECEEDWDNVHADWCPIGKIIALAEAARNDGRDDA